MPNYYYPSSEREQNEYNEYLRQQFMEENGLGEEDMQGGLRQDVE